MGASSVLKVGTKVKNFCLLDGDYDIDCKIDKFYAMKLKSEFVRKAGTIATCPMVRTSHPTMLASILKMKGGKGLTSIHLADWLMLLIRLGINGTLSRSACQSALI